MVAPALIVASHNIRGTPGELARARPVLGRAAGRVRRRRRRRARRRRGRAPPRCSPATSCSASPSSTATRRRSRSTGRVREGMHGLDRQAARAGHRADRRGRLRAAGADGRDGQGPAGAARRARLPRRGRRPRLGREPALHAHSRLLQARGPASATTRSWRGWSTLVIDRYDGSLKAEHGTGVNMAPVRRARVGAEGDRADAAGQARSPTPTACSPRGCCSTTTRAST